MLGYRFAPETVTKLRKSRGLTRYALGIKAGTSSDVVRKWEERKAKPSVDRICQLCTNLNLQPNYFFRKDERVK